jgi:hypothetical protein
LDSVSTAMRLQASSREAKSASSVEDWMSFGEERDGVVMGILIILAQSKVLAAGTRDGAEICRCCWPLSPVKCDAVSGLAPHIICQPMP